jgi:Heterokaryon incompatibility protein (HET)
VGDAVRVTKTLGLRYLWIDRLCIVQDDEEDWARESSQMCNIYEGAVLTISADESTSV